jgi:molybdopterin-containing oxidoreductase family membrane subunit
VENDADTVTLPRATAAWRLLVAVLVLLMGVAAFCFVRQTEEGFIATGLRNPGRGGAAWGLYIAFDVFFIGVSFAGITVAAIARLFHVHALAPITRIAELLTISALLAGGCVIMSDLGRPLVGLVNLPKYANPRSPFFGTFTLVVAGYLFSSVVFFFLSGRRDAARLASSPQAPLRWFYRLWSSGYRDDAEHIKRHRRTSFILSLTILPLLITAHSTLGLIFGIQAGRPGWFSALQAPAFVVMAGVSGTGVLIVVALVARKLFALEIPDATFKWLGTFLFILSFVYLYFIIVDEVTAGYAAPEADRAIAHQILAGSFAPSFWITVGSLLLAIVIPFVLYLRGLARPGWVAVAAVFANVAAVLKRLLLVVPSQTDGSLLPLEPGSYAPTFIEIGVVLGLGAMVAFIIFVFARIFPLVPSEHPRADKSGPPRQWGRMAATTLSLAVATTLIVFGLADSFRLLRPSEIDPVVPFSPVVFAVGVIVLFGSAAVYEVFPRRRGAPAAPSAGTEAA